MKRCLYHIIPIILVLFFILFEPLYTVDMWVCDSLYRQLSGTERNIKLITIDEETVEAYGNFSVWNREKTAELIRLLSAEEETAPAVIGLDIVFSGTFEAEADTALAEACRQAGNVVVATNLVYRGETKQDTMGNYYFDSTNIETEELPFAALAEQVTEGFSNTYISKDGYIRYTRAQAEFQGDTRESLAFSIYRKYRESRGEEVIVPETNEAGQFRFFYSGVRGEFFHASMKDVLDGKIPVSEFKDCIVLVGAYAPGFQDAYAVSVDRSGVMYGVEIIANIVQAFLRGKTAVEAPKMVYAAVAAVVVSLYLYIARKQRLGLVLLEAAAVAGLHLAVGRFLAGRGVLIPQIYVILCFVMLCIGFVIEKYILERIRRKRTLAVFKQYVAPQVVDELSKQGDFEIRLGGEKRDIACLFVDIRGFTPMSENLSPEQVVQILNEYLSLTTRAIFKNNGTLDKFIGDATMAVFNAPFDLEDYIYKAVLTAWDIREGSEELSGRLMEQFGKTISFGIGVNCGEAVVGNIGCDFRMDYTAIGDTVNTAARLESNAKPGEILISEAVFQAVGHRILAEEVGELSLKGKQKAVKTYRVVGMR